MKTCTSAAPASSFSRAEAASIYRVRELRHYDSAYGLGRAYLVTLVKPDKWQFLAFASGSASGGFPRERWHEVTGLVWEAEIGELVP